VTSKREIIEMVNSVTIDREVVVTTGVGSHQQLAARYFTWDYPKRQLITSAGHGTMGFGLPAAIGAQIANPNALVICFNGDGSANMDLNHLPTLTEYNLPVKVIVLDDSSFGIVRQFEDLSSYENVATIRTNPDFAEIARASKVWGFNMDSLDESTVQLEMLLNCDKPVLVHCKIGDYAVWPILEGGKKEMTDEH